MKPILLFLALMTMLMAHSQSDCTCDDELSFVIDYYEKNLASFSDNVNEENRSSYEDFKQALHQEAGDADHPASCFRVLSYYVEYFKDNHASIRMRSEGIDETDEAAVSEFLKSDLYKSREVHELKEEDLKQYPIEDIRGIYRISDVYTIAVIPDKTPFRDYIGVILESKSKIWTRDQVKLEIKQLGENDFQAFTYMRNHSLQYSGRYKLKNGILGDTWVKTSLGDATNYATNEEREFKFAMLNDSVAYLRIPTFSGSSSAKMDSLYEASDEKIRETPYLIIDVRDNGGGSDRNASVLLPYIYTKPLRGDQVELLVTEDNLNLWKTWQAAWEADPENYSKDDIKWIRKEVKRMEKAEPNTWITRSKAGTSTIKDVSKNPISVAIIQNQYCASSCESLLFWAMDSDRTVLVGENSGGYVGYGENGGLDTPCYNFRLTCTMTRYEEQRKYEADGVAPDHYLSYESDWILQTIDLLVKEEL